MRTRRQFVKTTGVGIVTIGIAGCSTSNGSGSGGTPNNEGSGGDGENDNGTDGDAASSSDDFHVGLVFPVGGTGDQGFADSANKGAERAVEELSISLKTAAPDQVSGYEVLQRRFAQSTNPNYNLVSCIGVRQQSALKTVAGNNSEQKFMIVDAVVDQSNVANYKFKEHLASFQAGHLAGLLTTRNLSAGAGKTNPDTKRVGFVGGDDIPLILKFQAGYEKGVAYANDEVEVEVAFAGSFNDPSAGKEIATSMYDKGADIVYHAAASTGAGVFQAAADKGRYAIGVDQDQSVTYSDFANVILASAVKRVNKAVFTSIESTANGNFKGGTTQQLGLESGGVGLVYGKQLGSAIPSDAKSALESSQEKIISGDISVPQKP